MSTPARHRASRPPGAGACDVVIACADSSTRTERAVQSLLEQQGCLVVIHLIDDGGGGRELLDRYGGRPNVVAHRSPTPCGLFAALHEAVPRLRSQYVAVQDPATVSVATRLRDSVGLLEETGGEILAAALETSAGSLLPEEPGPAWGRPLPSETLVFRRASLVDLGGVADRSGDLDAELVHRAFHEGRNFVLAPRAAARLEGARALSPLGPPPSYRPWHGLLRHHARGFQRDGKVVCDVVLPFRDHLEMVREALVSVLEQEGAEAVVHLIDDASREDTRDFLGLWASHPRVRVYQNLENLGPFTSFNNVLPFLETGFVAVQDADDVSEPDRLALSVALLGLSDADFLGAGHSQLGGGERGGTSPEGDAADSKRSPEVRSSRIPTPEALHFLLNPTAVMRRDSVDVLGGFADFGDTTRNRCGLDDEFYARAYHAGARFAVTRSSTVRYRRHGDQATRDPLTGWGSAAREWAFRECERRLGLYRRGPFDPRSFGALGRHAAVTTRLHAGKDR